MASAAQRVYDNDVIFGNLLSHLHRSTTAKILSMEQRGDRFDMCVKALWRQVHYADVMDMAPDNARNKKYLNAVIAIDASVVHRMPAPFSLERVQALHHRFQALCSPEGVETLRGKCPHLRLITRSDPSSQYTIKITRDSNGESVYGLHTHTESLLSTLYPAIRIELPRVDATGWRGFTSEHTTTLKLFCADPEEPHEGGPANPLLALLQDTDRLDGRITAIDAGNVVVSLEALLDIVESRVNGKGRITRLSAAVRPFTLSTLEASLREAGPDLELLDLRILDGEVSILTMQDLPIIMRLVRLHCIRLLTLRLPVSLIMRDVKVRDSDIPLPPDDISFSGGKLQTFALYLYGTGLDPRSWTDDPSNEALFTNLISFNATRNIACLIGPSCEIDLHIGEKLTNYNVSFLSGLHWSASLDAVVRSIHWFRRLGSILEPHFRSVSLSHLGVKSLKELQQLRYKVDGTPINLAESLAAEEDTPMRRLRRRLNL